MSTPFLTWLAEGGPRSNDAALRAVLPLMRQVAEAHAAGLVAPIDDVSRLFCDGGALWFHAQEAHTPREAPEAIAAATGEAAGFDVVGHGVIHVEVTGVASRTWESRDVLPAGSKVERPVYLPGYTSWEIELGHHDPLTDVFLLGALLASVGSGLDFSRPEDLSRFVGARGSLSSALPNLHPVIARAIVRMTEVDRHQRARDLPSLIDRLERYREVDDRVDQEVDFRRIAGFVSADRSSRRRMVQSLLQARLFDVSRRNRLIWFQPTQKMLDLTVASVPTRVDVAAIRASDLFLWDGPGGAEVVSGKPVNLERFVRFEESPWARGVLDQIRADDARQQAEYGFSELKLAVAFLNWHDLKEAKEERVRSPLLLLPVMLTRKRGVRDSYLLQATSEFAEVNPALRHQLNRIYGLDLPEMVDLSKTDARTFHAAVAAEITRSEPGVAVHLLARPQIRLAVERARRRLDLWRRRSQATGRRLSTHDDVSYSYSADNFQPLGLQLFQQFVRRETFALEEHLAGGRESTVDDLADGVVETEREVYTHTEAATGPMDWAVDFTHVTLGVFASRKMSLVRDYARMLSNSGAAELPAFDTLFSTEPKEAPPPIPPPAAFETFSVVPADPTQTAAIAWARSGRNFIIQGPPGTGKSQTITNLIADFAGRGQRVLFVCQKRAALDVVYHRLAQHGLDRLSVIIHDSQSDKKAFLDDLRQSYEVWSADPPDGPTAEAHRDALLAALDVPASALTAFRAGMAAPVVGGEASLTAVIGEQVVQAPAPPPPEVPPHGAWSRDRATVRAALQRLGGAAEARPWEEALLAVSPAVLAAPAPASALAEALGRVEALLGTVREAAASVAPGADAGQLAEALALAEQLAPLADEGLVSLLDPASSAAATLRRLQGRADQARKRLAVAEEEADGWREPLPKADTEAALALSQGFDATFFLLRWLSPAWWRLRGLLRARYDFARHALAPGWTAIIEALHGLHEARAAVAQVQAEAVESLGMRSTVADVAARVQAIQADTRRTALQQALLGRWSRDPSGLQRLLDAKAAIRELGPAAEAAFDDGASLDVDALASRAAALRQAAPRLTGALSALRLFFEASLVTRRAVRAVQLPPAQWDGAVARAAVEATLAERPEVARFDDTALARARSALRAGADGWRAANAEVVLERARDRFRERVRLSGLPPSALNAEEQALKAAYTAGRRVLEREFEKVVRHRSIRELSQGEAGIVVHDLKPIWLMSPLSISDTLPLEEQRFDVVIFDEASQIPLEEAVPAVHRAPQMIVVGDEMQLPPTSFFATSDEEEQAEEAVYDLDADSFLTHAARRLPATMLGWHYRSRSESLIRFSNEAFYAGRLSTIPDRTFATARPPIVATAADGEANAGFVTDRPISWHRVDGVYDARRNPAEATYIAGLVRGLLSSSDRTIGIVAFSEAQQSEIEGALSRLADADPAFRSRLDAEYAREDDGQLVGLFVKNLENVQGDERDVIILSICYAPDAKGRMVMNFGPINKGGGEKRLNVVFSRAKHHMAVVASINPDAIRNLHNDGASCFRNYLAYAEASSRGDEAAARRALIGFGAGKRAEIRAPAPAHAAAVRDALEARGWEVEERIGNSGFVVDLAVRHPDSDHLQVAVLLDGPAMHAREDAVETWHLRPGLLAGFGWRVVPVLATDWLADPEACVARVEAGLRGEPLEIDRFDAEVVVAQRAAVAEGVAAEQAAPVGDLVGRTVVITGSFSTMSRLEVEAAVREAGGRVARSVSAGVDLVIAGQRPGSKLEVARERGVPVLDEAGLLAALGRAG